MAVSQAWASPAEEALLAIARASGLSVVASGLPGGGEPFEGATAPADAAVRALSDHFGLEAVVWRGIIIAKPAVSGSLRERLAAALDEHARGLLLRTLDSGDEWAPGWEDLVVGCASDMIAGRATEESYRRACDAALWIAAQDLAAILRWQDAVADASAWLVLRSAADLAPGKPLPVTEYLGVVAPATDSDDPVGALQYWLPGAGWDPFTRVLEEEGATITRDELVRRALDDDRSKSRLALDGAERLTGDLSGDVSALSDWIREVGHVEVECDYVPHATVALHLTSAPTEDVLRALAFVLGAALTAEQGRASLRTPAAPLESVSAALPAPLWAEACGTSTELRLTQQATIAAMWAAVTDEDLSRLRTAPTRVRDLSPSARAAALRAARTWVAGDMMDMLQCLPERGGPVPLWLYERRNDLMPCYYITSPMRVEYIGGPFYLELKSQATGGPVLWNLAPPDEAASR